MLSAAQAQAQANVSAAQNEQQQLQNQQLQQMETAMQQQAQKLFTSWNVTPQQEIKVTGTAQQGAEAGSGQAAGKAQTSAEAGGAQYPFIKAGTIMFAVLDTAVNSDHPGPVMGTIVSGRLKGARIIGSLSRSKDRVILKFNMLTMKDWPETIGIDAVAINPDTAQTAIASDVDHHYLLRYGSLFAASFMSGYADAITNTGTTFYNTFGITVNNPDLSPKERFLVGLGEVGKNLASITKRLVNTPPTVRVSAGVGLGLLFTSDVKKEAYVQPAEGSSAGTQSGSAQQAASAKTAASSTSATEAEAETATKAAMSSDAKKAMRSAAKTAGNANVIK
jgi:intracellular multiplication protein IcmE